ncbi:MAG: hydantoinase B/oxoprolinase family protein [Anaerolineales bacterium]
MTVDAISLGVFRNLFASVAEEMGVTLQRSSFSPNIKERQDYSCALFDARGRMVAQAAHIPVHLGSMPASVKSAIESTPNIRPGDMIILNDPYHGGTHLPDITMVSPVYAEQELLFFVASRAHHADVGGMAPGSLPLSTELYQEGLIIPPIKLAEDGQVKEEILSLITANTRAPEERKGDIQAQIAAQRIGERRLLALIEKHGTQSVQEHALALMAYTQRMTENLLSGIPEGEYVYQDALESAEPTAEDIPIQVKVSIKGSSMTVDFTGSAPQVAGNLNAVQAVVNSATWYCVHLLSEEDIPMNHGCFQPVEVIVPPRSVLNPTFPAAVAAGNVETSQRIVDVVLGALAQALPERIPAASQGTMNNVTFGGISGENAFVFYETIGGGHGAGPQGPGLSGRHSHMTNTRNTPVEAIEHTLPVQILSYELREGSGGEGQYRGGKGIKRVYKFLAPAKVTVNSDRRKNPPYGLQEGQPGQRGVNRLIRDGAEKQIGSKAAFDVKPGDILVVETPGGGGWGKLPEGE